MRPGPVQRGSRGPLRRRDRDRQRFEQHAHDVLVVPQVPSGPGARLLVSPAGPPVRRSTRRRAPGIAGARRSHQRDRRAGRPPITSHRGGQVRVKLCAVAWLAVHLHKASVTLRDGQHGGQLKSRPFYQLLRRKKSTDRRCARYRPAGRLRQCLRRTRTAPLRASELTRSAVRAAAARCFAACASTKGITHRVNVGAQAGDTAHQHGRALVALVTRHCGRHDGRCPARSRARCGVCHALRVQLGAQSGPHDGESAARQPVATNGYRTVVSMPLLRPVGRGRRQSCACPAVALAQTSTAPRSAMNTDPSACESGLLTRPSVLSRKPRAAASVT